MKKRTGILLAVFMLLITISSFADGSNAEPENEFLQEINSAQTWAQTTEIIERYLGSVNFDAIKYNSLDISSKTEVAKELLGMQYESIDQFEFEFEKALNNIQDSFKVPSSGGSSSWSGGSTGIVLPSYNTYNISGVVSLPEGEVAPQGGLELIIGFNEAGEPDYPDYGIGIGGVSYEQYIIIIPEGSNSIQYSRSFSIKSNYSNIVGWIELCDDENAKYQTRFYTETIDAIDNEIIYNITVPYSERKIGGTFILPIDMEILCDDLLVKIDIFNDDINYSVIRTLKAGDREVPFLAGVKAGNYSIRYDAYTDWEIGLQHISNSGDVVYANAFEIDCTDIIIVAKERNYIEGYILIPDGETAPENGIEVSIQADSVITVNIPQGESSGYYRVGIANGRALRCSVTSKDYFGTEFVGGYYTSNGTLSRIYNERVIFDDVSENLVLDLNLIPIQTIKGIIELDEPLDCYSTISIYVRGEKRSYVINNNLHLKEGELSVPYKIEIDEDDDTTLYVEWRLSTNFKEYAENRGSGEITVTGNYSRFDIINITVEKKAVLFKGNIYLPNNEVANRDTCIDVYFRSDDNRNFHETIVIFEGENFAEYIIYGDTQNINDNTGEYILRIKAEHLGYTNFYYNSTGFSFNEPSIITVTSETIDLDINLPEPNQIITGTITLPVSIDNDMWMILQLYNGDNEWFDMHITIPKNTTEINYQFGLLIQNIAKGFKLKYIIGGANTSPYHSGFTMYLSEDGFTTEPTQFTFMLSGDLSDPFEINIDISDLHIRSYIKGEFVLPDGYIMPTNNFFRCSVIATNGEHSASRNISITEGENRVEYSIDIPEMHNNGEWIVYYMVGHIVEEPSEPVVPDSTLWKWPLVPDNPISMDGSVFHIPENFLINYKIYITEDGLSFNEEDAKRFVFTDSCYENVNINAFSTDLAAPKVVGGFFTSAIDVPENGLNVSVILIDINNGDELKHDLIFKGGAEKYKFEMLGGGEYILKYVIDDDIYYYQNDYTLTPYIDSASIISTMNTNAIYKKDVYYNNIYPAPFYLRYFNIQEIISPIEKQEIIKLLIYDINGNLLRETSENNIIEVNETPVIIGYEAGGYKGYFTGNNYTELSGSTRDFNKAARVFLNSLDSTSGSIIRIPVVGYANGINIDAKILNSYFDYDIINEDEIIVNSFNIYVHNRIHLENEDIFIVCYDDYGKMKFIKTLSLESDNEQIEMGWTIEKTDTIKIIGLTNSMKPLFEQLSFFHI